MNVEGPFKSRMFGEWFRGLIFLIQSYQNTKDQLIKKSQRILIIISIVVTIEQIFNYLNNDVGLRYDKKFDFYENRIKQSLEDLKNQWESQQKEDNIINVALCNEFDLDFVPSDEDFDSYFKDTFGVGYYYLHALKELFLLRDMLLHGHVYDFDVNRDLQDEGFYNIGSLGEGYGDRKGGDDSTGNKTSILGLNLFPEKIDEGDIKICCLMLRGLIRLIEECSECKLNLNSYELNLKTNKIELELDLLDQFIDFL